MNKVEAEILSEVPSCWSPMPDLPAYVTHYHPAEDRPFQNLSDLPEQEAQIVIEQLMERRKADPRHKRVFGRKYLAYRQQVENKLRSLYLAKGGQPKRHAPHYFVLGQSNWFQGAYPDARSIRLPLDALPKDQTTFTYPDSGVAMRVGPNFGLPPDPVRPYHERIFVLDELPKIVAQYGLPHDDTMESYDGYHLRTFEKYIEVQLWCDDPIREFLFL
jgi:hypothetical protein